MEKIVTLASVDLVLLLSPFLSYMLYDFMQDGMIFERWGKWLREESDFNEMLESEKQKGNSSWTDDDWDEEKIKVPFWKKPLGLCLKCFHVWVVIILALVIGVPFLKFIISLGVSYVILVKLFYD